jgi:glycerate 2-kinase
VSSVSPPLRLLVAPQEFKGSLTASEAADAIAAGAERTGHLVAIDKVPLSDGGPGLVNALTTAERGEVRFAQATDPLGRPVRAPYGLLNGGETGVVELAAASGLSLLAPGERDPIRATTFGTGELIRAALDAGARRLIIGLGGSATNDGGAGMLEALGVRLVDHSGQEIPRGGLGLHLLDRIDVSAMDPRLCAVAITVASDVRNPLCGPEGASAIFGPQKGATATMVDDLDGALRRYAEVIERDLGQSVIDSPGAGAAGGAGAALIGVLGGALRPGFELVCEAVHLRERLLEAQIVISGEGSLDAQTGYGKAVGGLAHIAFAEGRPLFVLAGILGVGYRALLSEGVTAAYSIVPGPIPLDQAEANAWLLLADASETLVRTIAAGRIL